MGKTSERSNDKKSDSRPSVVIKQTDSSDLRLATPEFHMRNVTPFPAMPKDNIHKNK